MIEPNPIKRFSQLYKQILKSDLPEPSAATLATATPDGKPSARIILLKGFDERGFVIYTNLESRKAMELRANPRAALCFYWEPIHHQIRIEGEVEQIPAAEANAYFAKRPRGSQIGAWASKQSSVLQDASELAASFQKYEKKFADKEVPRPDFWSGFRLRPHLIEFWERGGNRLHARTVYSLENDEWQIKLLYP